jgi:hypothetical protein
MCEGSARSGRSLGACPTVRSRGHRTPNLLPSEGPFMIFHSGRDAGDRPIAVTYQGVARSGFTATSGIRGALPGGPIMHDRTVQA